jgi:hypothetical protein
MKAEMRVRLAASRCCAGMAIAFFITIQACFAQSTFPQVWQTKFDNKANFLSYGDNRHVIGTTTKAMCMINGESGAISWTSELQDLCAVKSSDFQKYMSEADAVLVFDKKKGSDVMICLDASSGKELWRSEKYQNVRLGNILYLSEIGAFGISLESGLVMIDVRSGKEMWQISSFTGALLKPYYVVDRGELLLMNYQPQTLANYFKGFKNQLLSVNAKSGKVNWEYNYKGMVKQKVATFEPMVDLVTGNDKVLIVMNGLQVLDMNSGKFLWSTPFEESNEKTGLFKTEARYGVAADPLIVENTVYIADLTDKKEKKIRKYDLTSGKVLWESQTLDDKNLILPRLAFTNGMLVAQVGGYINIQKYIPGNGSNPDRYVSEWEWKGPFGLKAFDANTGSLLWKTDKFKDRITNIIGNDNGLYVAYEDGLLRIDPKSGNNTFSVDISKAKLGDPVSIMERGDKIVVFFDNGIAAYAKGDGANAYAFKMKKFQEYYFLGDYMFVKNEDMVASFNPDNGSTGGNYTFKKGYRYAFTDDGKYLYLFSSGKVTKYKVNG